MLLSSLKQKCQILQKILQNSMLWTKTEIQEPLLTREETEYNQNVSAPIKIGCIGDQPPLIYTDKETGKLDGIYIALLKKFSEISGIPFEFEVFLRIPIL